MLCDTIESSIPYLPDLAQMGLDERAQRGAFGRSTEGAGEDYSGGNAIFCGNQTRRVPIARVVARSNTFPLPPPSVVPSAPRLHPMFVTYLDCDVDAAHTLNIKEIEACYQ
jgi:hypothetical protein